jgi:hypothetical protein
MLSKIFISLLLLTLLVTISACTRAGAESAEQKEISLDDGKMGSQVYLDDSMLQDKSGQIITTKATSKEPNRLLPDNSEVETLIDGFGNKTETRTFKNHPRLRFIIVRTAVDGTKTITVYGYDSDTKTLDNFAGDPINASGDEIANAAKLYQTKTQSDIPPNFLKKRNIQPLPSSEFPVRPVQPVQTQPVVVETPQPVESNVETENPTPSTQN